MEFIGKITAVGEVREGVSERGSWKMCNFIIGYISRPIRQTYARVERIHGRAETKS